MVKAASTHTHTHAHTQTQAHNHNKRVKSTELLSKRLLSEDNSNCCISLLFGVSIEHVGPVLRNTAET